MKKYISLILLIIGMSVLVGCKHMHTTSISTYGTVQNEDEEFLQGIAIEITVEGVRFPSVVSTDENGYFYSRIKDVPYPIPHVTVTAIDQKGAYQKQSISPRYMFECGTGFVPEKDCAFPADEIVFVMIKNKTE